MPEDVSSSRLQEGAWVSCAWLVFTLILVCRVDCGGALADIYRYQDKNGVVHFSNVPDDSRYRLFMKEKKERPANSLYVKKKNRYDKLISKMAAQKGVDPHLVCAVVEVESNYDAEAVSHKGAKGLMQLMPDTASDLGVEDVFHPEQNLAAGMSHLKALIEKYRGDLELALAAYNAGEAAVKRYGGVPPYQETRNYVRKVLEAYEKRKERARP